MCYGVGVVREAETHLPHAAGVHRLHNVISHVRQFQESTLFEIAQAFGNCNSMFNMELQFRPNLRASCKMQFCKRLMSLRGSCYVYQ